jgi:hypothetical protein
MDREAIQPPAVTQNKEGVYQCKKHGSTGSSILFLGHVDDRHQNIIFERFTGCNQCFGWKKQITRARTAAKKAGKK